MKLSGIKTIKGYYGKEIFIIIFSDNHSGQNL